jgi:hypothetical protein
MPQGNTRTPTWAAAAQPAASVWLTVELGAQDDRWRAYPESALALFLAYPVVSDSSRKPDTLTLLSGVV